VRGEPCFGSHAPETVVQRIGRAVLVFRPVEQHELVRHHAGMRGKRQFHGHKDHGADIHVVDRLVKKVRDGPGVRFAVVGPLQSDRGRRAVGERQMNRFRGALRAACERQIG